MNSHLLCPVFLGFIFFIKSFFLCLFDAVIFFSYVGRTAYKHKLTLSVLWTFTNSCASSQLLRFVCADACVTMLLIILFSTIFLVHSCSSCSSDGTCCSLKKKKIKKTNLCPGCVLVCHLIFRDFWESMLETFLSRGLFNISWLCNAFFWHWNMLWIKDDQLHHETLLS